MKRVPGRLWTTAWLACLATGACAASEDGPPPATEALASEPVRREVSGPPVVALRSDVGDGFYAPEPPFAETSRWLGLFERANGWELTDVDVAWSTTPDSEPGELPLHEMSTEPPSPEILFGDVAGLEPGPALTVARYGAELRGPTSEAPFVLGDTRWLVRLESADAAGCGGVVTLSDGSSTQELFALSPEDPCGEPRFDVNWVGDLDGDGRLDLVATFSAKYSLHPRRLYLSSAAERGELVGLAALYEREA